MTTQPQSINEESIKAEVLALADEAPAVPHISNAEQFAQAGELVRDLIARRKEIEAKQAELVKPINEALRGLKAFFKGPLDLIAQRETAVRAELARFQRAERERAEAERRRVEEERQKALKAAQDEADLLALAGDVEEAGEALIVAAIKADTIQPAVAPLVTDGIGTRKTYGAEVVDFETFVRWAVTNGQADRFLSVKQPALNALARDRRVADGEQIAPGLKSVVTEGTVVRG